MAASLQSGHQLESLSVALGLGLSAEFDQEIALAFREELQMFELEMLFLQIVDEFVIERLQPDRAVRADVRDVIRRGKDIGITEHEQRTRGRAVY